MKFCTKCNRELDESCFGVNRSRYDGLQTACKECRRVINNDYYATSQNRKETVRKNKMKKIAEAKELLAEVKSAGCSYCGESEICTLDLHHVNPFEKEFSISRLANSACNIKLLTKEMSKCVVLCSNCHRKVHAGILECGEDKVVKLPGS